jgi:hypothetical protein
MSYEIAAEKSRSEKVVLCIAQAVAQYKVWSLYFGAVYVRDVDHWVESVKEDFDALTSETTLVGLAAGSFYFSPSEKKLYVRMSDDSAPKTKKVSVIHKFFFANSPYILPNDLSDGAHVEFMPIVDSIGQLGQQLDDENTGVVLESSSQITLQNNDGFFDEIFDTLIWENQTIEFYSWFPELNVTESQRLFTGVIESKDFDEDKIVFKVKDFVYKLKNYVNLSLFSSADGRVADSIIGKPKRRIYGQVQQIQCVGVDQVLEGLSLGLISVAAGTKALTGSSTAFLQHLSPGDELFVTVNEKEIKLQIDTIESDTAATLGSESSVAVVSATARLKPKSGYRYLNRFWNIAGHGLLVPTTTIVSVETSNRVTVLTTENFLVGDLVTVGSHEARILRISGDKLIFSQSLNPLPVVGDLVQKSAVQNVFFGSKELVLNNDWTLLNNVDGAILQINNLAEFNIAPVRSVSVNLTFVNGLRDVTTTAVVDLRTIIKPRDWIRKNKLSETQWYEVLQVSEQKVTLRTVVTGISETISSQVKNVETIEDDSLITVNCLGMSDVTDAGNWIKTAADAVRHLVKQDAGFENVNEDSFTQAKVDCPYILSLVIPASIGDKSPTVKEVITMINDSVFGSLYGNKDMLISYSILNARKPQNLLPLEDHDIISWEVSSNQAIVNQVIVNYRPFTDIFTGDESKKSITFQSEFVDRLIGIKNTDERTIYLYEDDKALIIAQRIAFFKSLPTCKVTVKTKMSLALTSVNDKMYLKLDRMFKRYGGRDKLKIGIVTGTKKNGADTDVDFTDLGNIFNRIPAVAPSGTSSYNSGTRDEAAKFGYVLDNDTLTPDNTSEGELGNNLIG